MNLEGKRDHNSEFIKDEHGSLLRDVEVISERWVRWFHTLLNTKSPKLDPNIAEGLKSKVATLRPSTDGAALKHLFQTPHAYMHEFVLNEVKTMQALSSLYRVLTQD